MPTTTTRPVRPASDVAVGVACLVAATAVLLTGTAQVLTAASGSATEPLTGGLTDAEVWAWAASFTASAAPWFVLLGLAVFTGTPARRTAVVGGAVLAVWTAGALLPRTAPLLAWPGPWPPWDEDADVVALTAAHPAAAEPLVLLTAGGLVVAGAARLATGRARRVDARAPAAAVERGHRPGAALTALLLYGALLLGAASVAARGAVHASPYLTARDVVGATSGDAAFVTLLVVVAAVVSGRGAWTLAVVLLAWSTYAVPAVGEWSAGGSDLLLVAAFTAGAAGALAWSWRPLRRAALGS